ncbi:hypothetical protein ACSBR2_015064 [Camellia fascicularis]
MVDDKFLDRLGLEKGTRKLVKHEERGRVLRAMDGCSYKAAAGRSLSNNLVALARLGARHVGGPPLNVAVAGSVGSDPLGGILQVTNSRGDVLQCSHYMPFVRPEGKALPYVIYSHGNSGCRADASEAAIILLPSNITVFTLDFSGSGLSGGENVTLGWNEVNG